MFLLKGYSYAGAENGFECRCGNSYGRYGMATGCTVPCYGDNTTMCGAAMKNTVAFTGLRKIWDLSAVQNSNEVTVFCSNSTFYEVFSLFDKQFTLGPYTLLNSFKNSLNKLSKNCRYHCAIFHSWWCSAPFSNFELLAFFCLLSL